VIIRGVTVDYDTSEGRFHALGPLDFTLNNQEVIALVGPSGCGKSTLAKVISGVISPTSGQVDFPAASGVLPRIFSVFQDHGVFPWLTVRDNTQFGLDTLGLTRQEIRQRVDFWLNRLDLSRFSTTYPHTLSGGMRQRVGLARAFAAGAEVLLLDEPFSAVDEVTRDSLQKILHGLIDESGGSALLITHSIDEAIRLADRVLVMNGPPGQIVGEWDCRAFSIEDSLEAHAEKYVALHAEIKREIGASRAYSSTAVTELKERRGDG
jgi:NitT/TauT family transport system ATP-binding protein